MAQISDRLRSAHPDAPWLWREDWASKRLKSAQGAIAAIASILAFVFSGFSIPLVLKAGELVAKEGIGLALLAAVLPLASIGLAYWAIIEIARWHRFRNTHLEIATLPGVVGGRFAATMHVGTTIDPKNGCSARLSCLRRTRSGKNSDESIIWQQEQTISRPELRRGGHGTAIPMSFEIPFESEPTSADPTERPSVHWRLEVSGELDGADLKGTFEVPVFKTAESSAEISERLLLDQDEKGDSLSSMGPPSFDRSLEDPKIEMRNTPDGGLEIFLPASRNRGGALAITLFAGFWNGFLYHVGSDLPGLFVLALAPFVLVGVLLALFVPVAWLQSTTIEVRPGKLVLHQKMLGRGSARELAVDQIEAIVPKAQGGNSGRTNWSVRIQRKGRKKARAAASNLSSKADAQKIAAMISSVLRG